MAGKLYLIKDITFSVNIGNTLKNDKDKKFLIKTNDVVDTVLKAIEKYSAHSGIK